MTAPEPPAPTQGESDQLAQAAIAKATRLLVLPEAPFGAWGEISEFGMAQVRPDYAIEEMLLGLRYRGLVIDWPAIVTADDVIRNGLGVAEPSTFPADRRSDVERALAAAIEWIEKALRGLGIA